MHQPPRIGVNPSQSQGYRSESHMPTASGHSGTTTSGSLVPSMMISGNKLGPSSLSMTSAASPQLFVSGRSTNPLVPQQAQQQQQQFVTNPYHRHGYHQPTSSSISTLTPMQTATVAGGSGGGGFINNQLAQQQQQLQQHHRHGGHPSFALESLGGAGHHPQSHLTSPVAQVPATPMLHTSEPSPFTSAGGADNPNPHNSNPHYPHHVSFSGINQFISSVPAPRSATNSAQQHIDAAATNNSGMVRDALVHNLKKQVACLELECKFLKEKLANAGGSGVNKGVIIGSGGGSVSASSASSYSPAQTDALIRRANELEAEVVDLRNRFAEREQRYQVELAIAKADAEAAVFEAISKGKTALSVAHQSRQVDAKEVDALKDLHAREVVALQKRIEQLDFELKYQYSEEHGRSDEDGGKGGGGGHRAHSRDAMAAEIAQFKHSLRTMETENATLKLQHEALLKDFASNQTQLVAAESANGDLKREVEALKDRLRVLSEGKIADLERQVRDSQSAEVNKHYEMQQAKAEAEKLRHDLKEAIDAKLVAEASARKAEDGRAAADMELTASKGVVRDVTSQRDKISADYSALLLRHSQLEVKCQQQQQKISGEGHSLQVLERQYCQSLDEIEALKRHARAKEEIYKGLDGTDNQFRAQLLLLRQERDALKSQLERLTADHAELTDKYNQIAHYAKQQAAEDKLRGALAMIGHTKEAMQTLLQTQMRLSSDISSAVGDIPDLRTVLQCPMTSCPSAKANSSLTATATATYSGALTVSSDTTTNTTNSGVSQQNHTHTIHSHGSSPNASSATIAPAANTIASTNQNSYTNNAPSYPPSVFQSMENPINSYFVAPTQSSTQTSAQSSQWGATSSSIDAIRADLDARAHAILQNKKPSSFFTQLADDPHAPQDIYPPHHSQQQYQYTTGSHFSPAALEYSRPGTTDAAVVTEQAPSNRLVLSASAASSPSVAVSTNGGENNAYQAEPNTQESPISESTTTTTNTTSYTTSTASANTTTTNSLSNNTRGSVTPPQVHVAAASEVVSSALEAASTVATQQNIEAPSSSSTEDKVRVRRELAELTERISSQEANLANLLAK